jgi:palmitoyl-protein thioesterase
MIIVISVWLLSLVLQTKLYTEDWIGLKTLDEAGRVKFVSVPGGHLRISRSDMKKYIVPYLTSCGSSKQSVRRILSI